MSKEKKAGNYQGWKKATINEDFTFFIEDIYVNPGDEHRTTTTPMEMHIVFENGRTFTRTLEWDANSVIMPLDIELSAHALEGEQEGSTIEISCIAYVDKIGSWSIDYNGDGIYDEVTIVQGDSLPIWSTLYLHEIRDYRAGFTY
jgi:hypothetical protein